MDNLSNVEATLAHVAKLLERSVEVNHEREQKFMELLERSERRVESVNSMVNNLISTMSQMTSAYIGHLDQICRNRDDMCKENAELLKRIASQCEEIKTERERYEALLNRFIDHNDKGKGTNTNNFNL